MNMKIGNCELLLLILFCYCFQLEPHVNGPFTPDYAHPISKLGEIAKKNDWPLEVKVGKFFFSFFFFKCSLKFIKM